MPGFLTNMCKIFGGNGKWTSEKPQFLMLGPHASGKTLLMYKLKFGDEWRTWAPDLEAMSNTRDIGNENGFFDAGYHYEEFSILKDCGIWDAPGRECLSPLWPMFFRNLQLHGIFFVVRPPKVDEHASSRKARKELAQWEERLHIAATQLHDLMHEETLRQSAFAVIINETEDSKKKSSSGKGKKGEASAEHELVYRLGLHDLDESVQWRVKHFVLDCSTINGENDPKFAEVVHWLQEVLSADAPKGFGFDFQKGVGLGLP